NACCWPCGPGWVTRCADCSTGSHWRTWRRWLEARSRGPQPIEDLAQLRRERRVEFDALPCRRMVEAQMLCVQEEARQIGERRTVPAVPSIAYHGMADGLEMHSDLVRASGVQRAPHQGNA